MSLNEYLTLGSIAATLIVGYILRSQIRAQKEIIEMYKGLVEAVSPEKIIALHQREVDKLKEIMGSNIDELQTQVLELATFTDDVIDGLEDLHKTFVKKSTFSRVTIIHENLPHCGYIIEKIKKAREEKKQLSA